MSMNNFYKFLFIILVFPFIMGQDSNDDIIYTIRPKEEVDLHNFVKDLG